jgi:hypothetical protein
MNLYYFHYGIGYSHWPVICTIEARGLLLSVIPCLHVLRLTRGPDR